MAKIDKSQYTKDEWRIVREQRRESKKRKEETLGQPTESVQQPSPSHWSLVADKDVERYVLCLKHGSKYGPEYVNTLNRMVKRNLSLPYKFCCLTDNTTGLDKDIITLPLPKQLEGWWCKPYMFSKDLPIKGDILYLDLDVVISGNIDKLFSYHPNNWCTIRDFTRAMRPKWPKYNSSVVRFKTGQLHHVWEDFSKDPKTIMRKFFGDQDWLYHRVGGQAILYPDSWVQSWKWEIRKTKEFAPGGQKGNKTFKHVEHVTPPPECCIAVFHGDPNPHNCADPWVRKNWQ